MRNASESEQVVIKLRRATVEVPDDLYQAYKTACALEDLTYSQAIRRHMREVVEEREAA